MQGMGYAGGEVSATLKREFSEEALGMLELEGPALEAIQNQVKEALSSGTEVIIFYAFNS